MARRARAESSGTTSPACVTASSANWVKGALTFRRCCNGLSAQDYKGYVLVEQDVLPGMGTPKESARRTANTFAPSNQFFLNHSGCISCRSWACSFPGYSS